MYNQQDLFRRLANIEENQKCFECGSQPCNWTSITYGIFVCLQCSSSHRSMGSYQSFVKSTDLDQWSDVQMDMMMLGGNHNFKQFLASYDIPMEPLGHKYNTKAVQFYKERLQCLVENKDSPFPPSMKEGQKIIQQIQKQDGSKVESLKQSTKLDQQQTYRYDQKLINQSQSQKQDHKILDQLQSQRLEQKIYQSQYQQNSHQYQNEQICQTNQQIGSFQKQNVLKNPSDNSKYLLNNESSIKSSQYSQQYKDYIEKLENQKQFHQNQEQLHQMQDQKLLKPSQPIQNRQDQQQPNVQNSSQKIQEQQQLNTLNSSQNKQDQQQKEQPQQQFQKQYLIGFQDLLFIQQNLIKYLKLFLTPVFFY